MPIVKALTGLFQNIKANKIKENRPTYTIPDEVFKNRNMAQTAAMSNRLPGQNQLENQMGANQASMVNAAMNSSNNSGDILAALGNINQNTNSQMNNLAIQQAQNKQANMDRLMDANNNVADYKQQEFDYNQNQPYELRVKRKMALKGAAMANWDSALNDTHEAGMSMLSLTGCFDGDTLIEMADESVKAIKDIVVGDMTQGGEVLAIHQFKAAPLLDYKGIKVTAYHAVWEDGKWIRVGDSVHAQKTEEIKPIYNLSTSNRLIVIDGILFSDHQEVGMSDQEAINDFCLNQLNKKNV